MIFIHDDGQSHADFYAREVICVVVEECLGKHTTWLSPQRTINNDNQGEYVMLLKMVTTLPAQNAAGRCKGDRAELH